MTVPVKKLCQFLTIQFFFVCFAATIGLGSYLHSRPGLPVPLRARWTWAILFGENAMLSGYGIVRLCRR